MADLDAAILGFERTCPTWLHQGMHGSGLMLFGGGMDNADRDGGRGVRGQSVVMVTFSRLVFRVGIRIGVRGRPAAREEWRCAHSEVRNDWLWRTDPRRLGAMRRGSCCRSSCTSAEPAVVADPTVDGDRCLCCVAGRGLPAQRQHLLAQSAGARVADGLVVKMS